MCLLMSFSHLTPAQSRIIAETRLILCTLCDLASNNLSDLMSLNSVSNNKHFHTKANEANNKLVILFRG